MTSIVGDSHVRTHLGCLILMLRTSTPLVPPQAGGLPVRSELAICAYSSCVVENLKPKISICSMDCIHPWPWSFLDAATSPNCSVLLLGLVCRTAVVDGMKENINKLNEYEAVYLILLWSIAPLCDANWTCPMAIELSLMLCAVPLI